jgi:hypothetical protein
MVRHENFLRSKRLPSLEKNIAKFRAMELILVQFRVERFKRSVVEALRATDRLHINLTGTSAKDRRLPDGKDLVDRALSILVNDGIFSAAETKEIIELIDYRNKIAHQVDSLLHDVAAARTERGLRGEAQYRYDALSRIDLFQHKFDRANAYVRVVHIENFGFFLVEDMFVVELAKLRKRINVQWLKRKELSTAAGPA